MTDVRDDVGPDSFTRPAASSVHEAYGRRGALTPDIRPVQPTMRVWGPAYPVFTPPGDNLALHWALAAAEPGDVLVVDAGGSAFGYWGEVMNRAALARGLGGLVIDGGVRDVERLAASELPVFTRVISIHGTCKQPERGGAAAEPVRVGGTVVRRGDLVIGDADGVLAVAAEDAAWVIAAAVKREQNEQHIMQRLDAGETTMTVYGLPPRPAHTTPEETIMRRSVYVQGLAHGSNPIPAAAVVGSLLMSGGVSGVDRGSGSVPADIAGEVANMFDNVVAIVEAGGGTLDTVARIDVALTEPGIRDAVNEEWVRRFPNPGSRPARKTEVSASLPPGLRVQCTFMANLEQAQR